MCFAKSSYQTCPRMPHPQAPDSITGWQAITAGHKPAPNLRFCSVRLGTPPIRPPLSACNSGASEDPAEPLEPITAADIYSLPHRMLHDLPFRLMRALNEAGALPLPPPADGPSRPVRAV